MATETETKNMELMQTLDDAWNGQDWDTFEERHKPDTVVRWPAQPPTHGARDHRAESMQMFKTIPDNRVHNRPYKVLFASGEWTCSIARFTGTMKGEMVLADGTKIADGEELRGRLLHGRPLAGGQIVEENLFCDVVG